MTLGKQWGMILLDHRSSWSLLQMKAIIDNQINLYVLLLPLALGEPLSVNFGSWLNIAATIKWATSDYIHFYIIQTMKLIILVNFILTYALALSYSSAYISTLNNNLFAPPTYPLGNLINTSILTISIQLPNGGSLSSFSVKVRNADNSQDVTTLNGWSGSSSSANWTVNANASYNLQVSGSTPLMFYLTATINSTITLLRLTDLLRNKVSKFFYIPPGQSTIQYATISPTDGLNNINLYTSSPSAPFTFTQLSTNKISNANGADNFTLNVIPGNYYLIEFTVRPGLSSAGLAFPNYNYPCIYAIGFTDFYGTFTSCSGKSNSLPGLPCKSYDYYNQFCLECVSGYTLSSGQCLLPIPCTNRQYYRFGLCYDVNPNCDQFDSYTGVCTSCINPTQNQLINGTCVFFNTLVCKEGTYAYGTICIPNSCLVAFNNGSCTACVSSAYYLSNGNCLPIDCGPNAYFSVKFTSCATIPAACSNFSVLTQGCQACITGYFSQNGVCVQPYGSANCKSWNFDKSVCSECLLGYSLILNICQINIITPITCPSGQYLVNKICVNLPANCLALNNFYICTECIKSYEISFGQCVPCKGPNPNFPCAYCPDNFFITSSGSCQQVSQYCKTSSLVTGLCLSCTSGALPVNGICCSSLQTVQNGVCVNSTPSNNGSSSGQGVRKDSKYFENCLYYSSSCDCCTRCRNSRYFDYADHCA